MVKVGVMRELRSIDRVTWIRADNLRVECTRCGAVRERGERMSFLDWRNEARPQFWLEHSFCKEPRKPIDGVGTRATLPLHPFINGVREKSRQVECTFFFGK